ESNRPRSKTGGRKIFLWKILLYSILTDKPLYPPIMKQRDLRFFLLIFLSILVAPLVAPLPARSQEIPASSQGSFNYDEAWKVVDSLSLKGLARQASSEVEKIYKQARAERNDAMLVKAVIHRILFQSSLE